MFTFWMAWLTALLVGQAIGMHRGWPLTRHIGSFTTRHWAILATLSGLLAWLYFHWVVAFAWSPGLTARVILLDLVVFLVFFYIGRLLWFLRKQNFKGDSK